MDESHLPGVAAYARIPERNTGDNLLRTAQQYHVALSTMADTKANIIITVASIVLTLCIGRLADPELRLAALVLAGFSLLAQLLAILAVLPKYRPPRLGPDGGLPTGFNLMFFGHFASLSRERYLEEMARVLVPDGSPYATWVNDLYSNGAYLAKHKYRYLRYSYLFFLAGFLLASAIQAWRLI